MLRLVVGCTGADALAAQSCERGVFMSHFNNTPDELDAEYGPYDGSSEFIAVFDGSDAVGVIRVVLPSAAGLKTLLDISRHPWSLDAALALGAVGLEEHRIWDIATLAVRKEYSRRNTEIAVALYHGLAQAMDAAGVRAMVSVVDERARRVMRAVGVPLVPMPGATAQDYIGSLCTPVTCEIRSPDGNWNFAGPSYDFIVTGTAIRSVELPPVYALPERRAAAVPEPA